MAVRRIIYSIFLAVAVWVLIVFIDYSALQLLVSLIIIPLIMGVVTFIATRRITVNLEVKDIYVVKKKSVQLYIKVTNPSILPFISSRIELELKNGFSTEVIKKKLNFNIADREIGKYTLEIRPEYVGRIDILVKKFKLYDYTGLWAFKGKIGREANIYVLPQNGEVNVSVSDRNNEYIDEPMKYSDNESGDDCSQVFDIREFREGDKLQRIHWKLSAKKDDIFVKEFSMPIDASVEILAELSVSDKLNAVEYTDTIIETAYGLSVALLEQEIYHYFSWYSDVAAELVRKEITDENDIWNALYELYHTGLYSQSNAIKVYQEEADRRNSYLFYITADEETIVEYSPHKRFLVGSNSSSEDVVGVELGNVYESIKYLGEV